MTVQRLATHTWLNAPRGLLGGETPIEHRATCGKWTICSLPSTKRSRSNFQVSTIQSPRAVLLNIQRPPLGDVAIDQIYLAYARRQRRDTCRN